MTNTTTTIGGAATIESSSLTLSLEGNVYDIFAESIRSKVTKSNYTFALKRYMRYRNVTRLEQLLPESPSPNSSDIRCIESDIIKYIVYLKNVDKLGYGTIHNYLVAIEHFYTICGDLSLNYKKISRYLPEPQATADDRGYTRDEIAKMLDGSDTRIRALILLLASNGMRIGAIADKEKPLLKLKHLSKIKEHNLYKITVYQGFKEEYICFTTPEATKAIDAYLEYRERYGEKLAGESDLFREQFNTSEPFDCKNPKPMHLKGLSRLIAESAIKSGVMQKTSLLEGEKIGARRNKIFRTHGFRKFVTDQMIAAGVSDFAIEKLLGHKTTTGITGKHYYRPQEEELLREYLKCINFLTINDENRLRLQVEQLTIKKSEFEIMKEKIEEFEEFKAATRDHINTQVKESLNLEGVKISEALAEMLYKEDKARLDKAIAKYKKEHDIIN